MVADRIFDWARSQPKKIALVQNGAPLSYEAFARAIEAARRFFEPYAMPVGGIAVVHINLSAEAWFVTLALRMLGLDTICLNASNAAEKLELDRLPNIACFVTSGSEPRVQSASAERFSRAPRIVVPANIYREPRPADMPAAVREARPYGGHILFTSGTTGTYKKVLFHGERDERRNLGLAAIVGLNADTVYNVTNFGLWTGLGLKAPSAVWQVGGSVVLDQRPDWADHFYEHGANEGFLAPFMIPLLLDKYQTPHPRRAEMELVIAGGFTSKSVLQKVSERLAGNVRIMYGATESEGMLEVVYRNGADLDWYAPMGDTRVEVVDEADRPCEADTPGYLRFPLTDKDTEGYLNDEAATAVAYRHGCFYTGDMAIKRGDGRVRILGRVADVLNVRGTKIAAAPLEQAIQNMLSVANVCLFGGLNAEGTEELMIAVEAERVSRDDLDQVAARFPEFRRFEKVKFALVKEFPRTEAGMQKINRVQLKDMIWKRA